MTAFMQGFIDRILRTPSFIWRRRRMGEARDRDYFKGFRAADKALWRRSRSGERP